MKVNSANQASSFNLLQIFTRLKKSHFIRNVLVVMSGTAMAQAIGFALTPIISRLYSPLDFGVFGSFNAVLTVIVAGVTLDYTQAIMLPKQKEDAINLFMLSCVSIAIVSCCLLAFCLPMHTSILNRQSNRPQVKYSGLLQISLVTLIKTINKSRR